MSLICILKQVILTVIVVVAVLVVIVVIGIVALFNALGGTVTSG